MSHERLGTSTLPAPVIFLHHLVRSDPIAQHVLGEHARGVPR